MTCTLQTEIKIRARHGAAAASRLQPELGILSSIFHVFLPLIDFLCLCVSLSLFNSDSPFRRKLESAIQSSLVDTNSSQNSSGERRVASFLCPSVYHFCSNKEMYFHLRCPKTGIGVSGCKEACVTYLDAVIIIGIFRGPVLCTANSPGMRKVRPSLAFAPLFAGRVLKGALLEKQPLATSLRAHAPLPG